jgi:hypothetical protein
MLTLVSNQQKTHFSINGRDVGAAKVMSVMVPNQPLTITAKPEGYIEKEDYIQPPYHDNTQIGFYFLIEDRIANAPAGTLPPKSAVDSPPSLIDVGTKVHTELASQKSIPSANSTLASARPTPRAHTNVSPRPTSGERRVALVIGNSAYRFVPTLSNPRNDAQLIAGTLKRLGFIIVGGKAQIDLDKPQFDTAVQSFGDELRGATVALFYYAGHGVQVRGMNYLIPISANPTKESDVDFQMVDAELVMNQMDDGGTRLNILILDACRNNPFGRGLRGTEGGLAQMPAPKGTLISYATQPGNVAQDGEGRDSPYTQAVVDAIQKPGVDVLNVFNEIGVLVDHKTGGEQRPWLSSSPIEGEFYFAGEAG